PPPLRTPLLPYTTLFRSAGLAPNADALNAARFVQGVGSGLINPQGIGMIQQYFRGAERGKAFGYFGSVVGVAVGIGPVLGGLLRSEEHTSELQSRFDLVC